MDDVGSELGRPPQSKRWPSNRVQVDHGWLVVDGCRVARVVEAQGGKLLAFHDKDRWRSRDRGCNQPSATIGEIQAAIEQANFSDSSQNGPEST